MKTTQPQTRWRGRPVLGAIAGLLFGFFVAFDLQQFGVRPMDNLSLFGLPLVGLVIGLVLAFTAPFARAKSGEGPPPQQETEVDQPAV